MRRLTPWIAGALVLVSAPLAAYLLAVPALMAHRYCLRNDPGLIGVMVATDFLIAGAYLVIPAGLHIYARASGAAVPRGYRFAIYSFELFIATCGLTHIMDIVTLFTPAYALEAGVNVACALASVLAAVVLIRSVPSWSLEHWRKAMRLLGEQIETGE